jgi:hypothetical protein
VIFAGAPDRQKETCLLRRPLKYIGALLPTWRNWQTRQTQNLVLVRVCGFDPLRRHHLNPLKGVLAVALECGNSPQVIFSNYRALATDAEAKAWFSILPPQQAENVVPLQLAINA